MECNEIRELLVDYLYGETSDEERAMIETHLKGCSGCAVELAQLRKARGALALLGSEVPVLKKMAPARDWQPVLRRVIAYAAIGAAAVLLLLVLFPEPTGPGRPGIPLIPQAQAGPTVKRKSVALTVYNGGFGVVRDRRIVRRLPAGKCELSFVDVAAKIEPHTVKLRSLSNPHGVTVLAQDFLFDLVGAERLLQKRIGEHVDLLMRDGSTISGILQSVQKGLDEKLEEIRRRRFARYRGREYATQEYDETLGFRDLVPEAKGTSIVIKDDQGSMKAVAAEQVRHISFKGQVAQGLVTRPTLKWTLGVAQGAAGNNELELLYLTQGVTWRADYDMVLGNEIGLLCWLTLTNNCGTAFDDAKLKLVAGEVHRAPLEGEMKKLADGEKMNKAPSGRAQVKEKKFFEYHMYEVVRPVTVKNGQTKQIKMFERSIKNIKKEYYITAYPHMRMDSSSVRRKATVMLLFKNSEENGLGLPLPAGRVRLFVPISGENLFARNSNIDHTPKDEDIKLPFGQTESIAWRVTAAEIQTARKFQKGKQKLLVRNLSENDAVVRLRIKLSGDWEISNSSHQFEKEDAQTALFNLNIKAGEEVSVEYSWEIVR